MYILVRTGVNASRTNIAVAKTKKILDDFLKTKGYYWSKSVGRYIDDKTTGIKGGSGNDYIIEQIDELR